VDADELKVFLDRASEAYYTGEPIMSDEEFDYLADLINYENVGYTPEKKHTHKFRMYSLQKYYDVTKAPIYSNAVITPKLDGAAISLLYFNGLLVRATTRGDGVVGENISEHVKHIPGVLDRISVGSGFLQVNGEVVAPIEIENSRNYVSGALHLKDPTEVKTRDLMFIAYGVYPFITDTFVKDLGTLEKNGFYVVDNPIWKNKFPMDGHVYRENNNDKFEDMGHTAKHPRGAFALKDASDVVTLPTTLTDVIWQVGAGGKVTPVAIFDEIEIDGAKINRATLHNAGFVESLDLCIGDTLLVTRRGGIIPYVTGKL
jgi:DNA ligase (NAD+)